MLACVLSMRIGVCVKELDMRKLSFSVAMLLAIMSGPIAGCMSEDAATESQRASEVAATPSASAYALHIDTEFAGQDEVVANPGGACVGSCDIAYLAGTVVSLRIPFPTDKINCIHFAGWTGACANQGNPCTLVMNSDLSTEVIWATTKGCQPQ
jgi:hypothetical protein